MYSTISKLLFLALLLLLSSLAQANTSETYRLADGIEPSFQQITLKLDSDQPDFTGSTSIELTVTRTVDRIEFYQANLELISVRLKSSAQCLGQHLNVKEQGSEKKL